MSTQALAPNVSAQTAVTGAKQGPSLVAGFVLLIVLGVMWGWLLGIGSFNSNTHSTATPVETQVSNPASTTSVMAAPVAVAKVAQPVFNTPMAQSSPSMPALQLETALYTVAFQPGRVDLSPSEKVALGEQAKAQGYAEAVKIHVQGRSGNSAVAAQERQRLAFERAWTVKEALVNDFGVAPAKVRLFTMSNDHYGKPRVDINAFQTVEAAAEDAKKRLVQHKP